MRMLPTNPRKELMEYLGRLSHSIEASIQENSLDLLENFFMETQAEGTNVAQMMSSILQFDGEEATILENTTIGNTSYLLWNFRDGEGTWLRARCESTADFDEEADTLCINTDLRIQKLPE